MDKSLENLSKEELLELVRIFSKNWLTVDGLWFTLVEDRFGLDAALDLDLKMWQRNSTIEAHRIKKFLGIGEGSGVEGVLRALHLMAYDPCMPFEYLVENSGEAYFWYSTCRPQEGRIRAGREPFPCKDMGYACCGGLASVIDPGVKLECVFCPPDDHPPEIWCKWKLTRTVADIE